MVAEHVKIFGLLKHILATDRVDLNLTLTHELFRIAADTELVRARGNLSDVNPLAREA
jgi:hypothetical protein